MQASGNPYRFVGDCSGYFLPHTYPYAGTRLLVGIAHELELALAHLLAESFEAALRLADRLGRGQYFSAEPRVVFEERARAFDRTSANAPAESRRKVRTLAGNYQILAQEPRLAFATTATNMVPGDSVATRVNLTNDGWFRWSEQKQHLQAAIFRSIENRAPTARAARRPRTSPRSEPGVSPSLPDGEPVPDDLKQQWEPLAPVAGFVKLMCGFVPFASSLHHQVPSGAFTISVMS